MLRSRHGARSWRWTVLLVAVAVAVCLPVLVAATPARDRPTPAAELLARVRASGAVAYEGYAESRAGLGLPDVPRARQVVALLGETTRMRAWVQSPQRWRVDQLSTVGERDLYHDEQGTWLWDSGSREASLTRGESVVRFARPADLLPPELGRRLAAEAAPGEVSRIGARRVAGVDAQGLRIRPRSPDTTVGRVDLWADPRSGLPVRVELTARGAGLPVISTSFLDLRQRDPGPVARFAVPPDARVDVEDAPDVARAVDRFSPFVLPDRLAALHERSTVAGAARTYGSGFAVVAVLAFPASFSPRTRAFLAKVPQVSGPWGQASLIETPLLNGLVFERDEVAYALAGTVPRRVLEQAAGALARDGARVRSGVGG